MSLRAERNFSSGQESVLDILETIVPLRGCDLGPVSEGSGPIPGSVILLFSGPRVAQRCYREYSNNIPSVLVCC